MDADVQCASLRRQARIAREVSEELREASRALIAVSKDLRRSGSARFEERRRGASRRLVSATAAVDDGLVGWSAMRPFIEFDSAMVGRDVVIEDAKTVLCENYGISRGEAFAILRSASSHSNRKLRDVAEKLVAEAAGD